MSSSSIEEDASDIADKVRSLEDNAQEAGPLGICETETLCFIDIRYRITTQAAGKTDILKGISGYCQGGRLLALMGASGDRTKSRVHACWELRHLVLSL